MTHAEAARRLSGHGPDVVPRRARRPAAVEYLLRFRPPLILLPVAACVAAALGGDIASAATIVAMVVPAARAVILREYARTTGDAAPDALVLVYPSLRAGVRARYLGLARQHADCATLRRRVEPSPVALA